MVTLFVAEGLKRLYKTKLRWQHDALAGRVRDGQGQHNQMGISLNERSGPLCLPAVIWWFPKTGGPFLVVPIIRIIMFLGLYNPIHHVIFANAYKDRIQTEGRRRGMKFPYWIEVRTQRYFPQHWSANPGRGIFGPNVVYGRVNRDLKHFPDAAPMRDRP